MKRGDTVSANNTSSAQKAINQAYYALSNPVEAAGHAMKYGYVPQGNVGNYGHRDDADAVSTLINDFNPLAWANAAYRFSNEVDDKNSWTTGMGGLNMAADLVESLPFFGAAKETMTPAIRAAANHPLVNGLHDVIASPSLYGPDYTKALAFKGLNSVTSPLGIPLYKLPGVNKMFKDAAYKVASMHSGSGRTPKAVMRALKPGYVLEDPYKGYVSSYGSYNSGNEDLVRQYIYGEGNMTKSDIPQVGLDKYTDIYGPIDNFKLQTNFGSDRPITFQDLRNAALEEIDYTKPYTKDNQIRWKGLNPKLAHIDDLPLSEQKEALVKAVKDEGQLFISQLRPISEMTNVNIAGHNLILKYDPATGKINAQVQDLWKFTPDDYAKKWGAGRESLDKYGIKQQARLMDKAGKPFSLQAMMEFDPEIRMQKPAPNFTTDLKALEDVFGAAKPVESMPGITTAGPRIFEKKKGGAVKRVKINALPKAQNGIDWEALGNPELGRRAKVAGWDNVEQYRNAKWAYNTTAPGTPKGDLPKFPTRVGPTKEAAVLDTNQKEQMRKFAAEHAFRGNVPNDPAGLPGVPIFESLLMAPVALASTAAALNAPLLGTGVSAANIINPLFFGQGIKNTLDSQSDMRKSWSKAYNDPSKSNLLDATVETGLNSLNFLGAGSVGSDLNKLGNYAGNTVNSIRGDIDVIRNARKYAADMQWQAADDIFNIVNTERSGLLGSPQLRLPGSFSADLNSGNVARINAGGSRNLGVYNHNGNIIKVVKNKRAVSPDQVALLQNRLGDMDNVFFPKAAIDLGNKTTGLVMNKANGIDASKLTTKDINNIPEEHWNKFEKDVRELSNRGVQVDLTKRDNLFYDKNKGFSFIDINGISMDGTSTNKFIDVDGVEHYHPFEQYPFFPKEFKGGKSMFESIPTPKGGSAGPSVNQEHLDMNRYDGENMGAPVIYKQGGSVKKVKINTLPNNWKTK